MSHQLEALMREHFAAKQRLEAMQRKHAEYYTIVEVATRSERDAWRKVCAEVDRMGAEIQAEMQADGT